jgi:hypothetical protein
MKVAILAIALVACFMSAPADAQFGLGLAGMPFVPPIILPRFGLGGLFGGGLFGGGLFGGGLFGGGLLGRGIGGIGFPFPLRRRFPFGPGPFGPGPFGRKRRSTDEIESELKEIESTEIESIAVIKKEIQQLAAMNRTMCSFDFEESMIRCERFERESFECEVEPRLEVISDMTRIMLPSLSMTQVPLALGEKEVPAISLYSPVRQTSTLIVKGEEIVLSIFDKAEITAPGWFVKDSKCFERLNGMISSEVLTKVFPKFRIDWVREE